jgi:hypothetical protein
LPGGDKTKFILVAEEQCAGKVLDGTLKIRIYPITDPANCYRVDSVLVDLKTNKIVAEGSEVIQGEVK